MHTSAKASTETTQNKAAPGETERRPKEVELYGLGYKGLEGDVFTVQKCHKSDIREGEEMFKEQY